MNRFYLLGGLLVIFTLLAVLAGLGQLAAEDDPLAALPFRVAIILCVPLYLAAVAGLSQRTKPNLTVVLSVAVAVRLMLLIAPPMLSSDLYRYIWDGRVQMAGINPYLFVPDDENLRFLRDAVIFPMINRASYAHTIYPPAAQIFFALTHSLTTLRIATAGLDGLVIVLLIRLLRRSAITSAHVLIYAWNPLVFWEFGNNAHVDALAALLLLVAVLAVISQRPIWAGVALGAAMLTKFLPAIVAPALWPRGGWRMALAAGATVAGLYAAYANWDHAGWQVLGFLGQYGQEEKLDTGQGYWLLAVLGLPGWFTPYYLAAAACGLAALGGFIAFVSAPRDALAICRTATWLIIALLLILSPHYAWYYGWLAAFAAIAPSRAAVFLSSAALLLYQQTLPDHVLLPSLIFAPTLLLLWADWRAPLLKGTG